MPILKTLQWGALSPGALLLVAAVAALLAALKAASVAPMEALRSERRPSLYRDVEEDKLGAGDTFLSKSLLRPAPYRSSFLSVFMLTALSMAGAGGMANYKGVPYQDSRYKGGAQRIPGRVECAYYDSGGEGVAYHDSDAKNNGSGGLNPADGTYLNQFRMDEGVDISYTKFHDQIDNSPYDLVQPQQNQLYVGWTEPGEWFNLTVEVARAGVYRANLLYTSNRGGTISIDVNGKDATGPLTIVSTYNAADTIAWRQWHHWNLAPGIAKLRLPKGKSVLTVHILTGGNMNLAYFDFKKN